MLIAYNETCIFYQPFFFIEQKTRCYIIFLTFRQKCSQKGDSLNKSTPLQHQLLSSRGATAAWFSIGRIPSSSKCSYSEFQRKRTEVSELNFVDQTTCSKQCFCKMSKMRGISSLERPIWRNSHFDSV